MKDGCKIEYDNDNQVCIIPYPTMPLEDCALLIKLYGELGYKWWLPADERKGFILSKIQKEST